ncbi:inner membrane protein YeeA, partial [Salmonella enterica subsp. enterica serovar Heidelberg str. 622737-12]
IGGTILGAALGLVALRLELFSLPLMLVWCAIAMFLCGWLALGKTVSGATDRHNACRCCRRSRW